MSIRDVLVHVKSYEPWSEHIDVTGRIARAFGARLTGLRTLRDIAMLRAGCEWKSVIGYSRFDDIKDLAIGNRYAVLMGKAFE